MNNPLTQTTAVPDGRRDPAAAASALDRPVDSRLAVEVARRRTFAIISHPDAGKTTLTEKLLLYGGAVHLAGSVRAQKNQRSATSDWMQMEQDRGISVTSTVLQFGYNGYCVNLLDTPGHQDFSEDTYRTLTAADSAVMVLDAAKGIEEQTTKLFRVCRQRGIPILTFINKLDRPGKDRLELMDEIGSLLQMDVVPMNWPVGSGDRFAGVYDRDSGQALLFQRAEAGREATIEGACAPDDPRIRKRLGPTDYANYREELELLDAVGAPFDHGAFLAGEQTPVFFGSALNNFGVQMFLDRFLEMAPSPGPRASESGPVDPVRDDFAAFVFKIQSNMNPQHRDSVAFVRVCSGHFERDMQVHHSRTGQTIRLSRPHRSFANEREILDEAFPGDVIGLINPGAFTIGDTICTGDPVRFEAMPRFAPEHFAVLHNVETRRYKQFQKGVVQLEAEGAMQVYEAPDAHRLEPILGVVGRLQFDVVQFRLESEYGVKTRLELLPHSTARLVAADAAAIKRLPWSLAKRVVDTDGLTVALFTHEHMVQSWENRYPVKLHEIGAGIGVFASQA